MRGKKIACLLMLILPVMTWAKAPMDSIIVLKDATGKSYMMHSENVQSVITPMYTDTLKNMSVVQRRRMQRMDREVLKATFVPKGTWLMGGTVSYYEADQDNQNFLVLKDVTGEGYTFGVSPYVGYFFRDNMAVGVRYAYNRTYMDLENFELNLGEDFNISLKDLYWLEHKYEASLFLRTYMPIGKSKIFGFFNEARLTYAYSCGKNSTGSGVEFDGSYEKANHLQIGCAPGLSAFITDFAAAEVSVGVLGYGVKWVDQHTNRVESGTKRTATGNFKINLFSINIGMTLYL